MRRMESVAELSQLKNFVTANDKPGRMEPFSITDL